MTSCPFNSDANRLIMAALTFPIISKLNVPVILSFKWLCFFKYWNMALLYWLTPDCVRKDLSYSTYGAQAIHRHAIFMGLAIFFNFLRVKYIHINSIILKKTSKKFKWFFRSTFKGLGIFFKKNLLFNSKFILKAFN